MKKPMGEKTVKEKSTKQVNKRPQTNPGTSKPKGFK